MQVNGKYPSYSFVPSLFRKWMSVKDIMPPLGKDILVFDGKNEFIDRMDSVDEFDVPHFEMTEGVTHWRDLNPSDFVTFPHEKDGQS